MDQVLHRVRPLTYLQSKDPVWFLLRAFRFTSRSGHRFLCAVTRDYENRLHGMSADMPGKCISVGSSPLSNIIPEIEHCISERRDAVLRFLGMKKQRIEQYSDKRNLAGRLWGFSQSWINSFTKNELQKMFEILGRRLEMRVTKAQLVAALLQLKQGIIDETVNLDEIDENVQSEATLLSEAKFAVKNISRSFGFCLGYETIGFNDGNERRLPK